MADIELVIKIDEDTYKDIKKGKVYSSIRDVPQESVVAIAKGTPLPAVEWIPTSRENPKKKGEYLVTSFLEGDEEPYLIAINRFDPDKGGWLLADMWIGGEITAWMDMPEPYRKECDE